MSYKSKYAKIRTKFKDLAVSDNNQIENLAKDFFSDSTVSNSKIKDFMVEASQNEQWREEFNRVLKIDEANKVKAYSKEDIETQLEIMDPSFKSFSVEQKAERIERVFATTGSDTSSTNVAIDPILPTNILDVDEYLFNNDSSVISRVTTIRESGETQMPEFDIAPTPTRTTEAGIPSKVEVKRRDAADYKLNANTKIQITTLVNELALRKGSPVYFAKLRQALVRETINEIAKQVYNGTDGSQQFHGILASTIPATVANKRGSFDVSADTNIAAESNIFRKLVLMLGTLPSNLSIESQSNYSWQMNRNTLYQKLFPSLDGQSRYYMESIMNGVPALLGPGGLPIQLVSKDAIADGVIVLAPLEDYYLNLPDGVEILDDGGIVNFEAGQTLIKAFCYADGGFIHNYMRTSGWTTGSDDNRDRNAWRYITGL